MIVIGLTGAMGAGKSETAKMFARHGAAVYDADATVHALYTGGGAAVPLIEKEFPEAVRDGAVDRAALSRLVIGDPAKLAKLEEIVHPLAEQVRKKFIEQALAEGRDMVVLDIPLLFETGAEAFVDAVVVVSADEDVRRARVLSRPGMTEHKYKRISARQMSDAEKRARADYVVRADAGLEAAAEQVAEIVAELRRTTPRN